MTEMRLVFDSGNLPHNCVPPLVLPVSCRPELAGRHSLAATTSPVRLGRSHHDEPSVQCPAMPASVLAGSSFTAIPLEDK